MKKLLLGILLLTNIKAQTVTLTSHQERDWQIVTQKADQVSSIPLGEFVARVVTPSSSIQSLSLPFEVHTKLLHVAKFQQVKKGDLLAEVTGDAWIKAQQLAIEKSIVLRTLKERATRQNILCKEGVISQKICLETNAEMENESVKLEAAKALLENYGASSEMIQTLLSTLKFKPYLKIYTPSNGIITLCNAIPGRTVQPSEALFVLNKKGALWIESEIEARYAAHLHEGEDIEIDFAGRVFTATVLHRSLILKPQTQTQMIRFEIPENIDLLSGTVATLSITRKVSALKIPKNAVINHEGKKILFVKTSRGYEAKDMKILSEDRTHYYIDKEMTLDHPVATTSLAILKNLLGEEDE